MSNNEITKNSTLVNSTTNNNTFQIYDVYNYYLLNRAQQERNYLSRQTNLILQNENELDETSNNEELYKYLIISIIFIVSLSFTIILFCIINKIFRNCCKKYKIKNRLLVSECCRGCCLCLFHKYTAERLVSSSKAQNLNEGELMMAVEQDIDAIILENKLPMIDKEGARRQSIFKYLRNFYKDYSICRKKELISKNNLLEIYKILKINRNNSNSNNNELESILISSEFSTRQTKILSSSSSSSSSSTFNDASSFLYTANNDDSLLRNLFKENFKDYNDIDFSFITNDIILTDSHLNSEICI